MQVVIVGGNECMVRQYMDVCQNYQCQAKVFCKMCNALKDKVGNPGLMILFTNTASHKMVKCALNEVRNGGTVVEHCHSSSLSALRRILDKHASSEATLCQRN